MKKIFIFTLAVLFLCLSISVYAEFRSENNRISDPRLQNEIVQYMRDWINKNYSEHYILSDININIEDMETNGVNFEATMMVDLNTLLKYKSAEDLPYFVGMKNELDLKSLEFLSDDNKNKVLSKYDYRENKSLNLAQTRELEDTLRNLYFDAKDCINKASPLSLYIVVKGEINASNNWEIYIDEMGTLIPAENFIPKSSRELENIGKADINFLVDSVKNKKTYSLKNKSYNRSYDRIAARDYALDYSSNGTGYCHCGILYGVNYGSWNNSGYPYFDNACHNDCADFVSQALHAGGIPIDSGRWERLRDGNNGWAWTSVSGLKDYMTSKGYWTSSNFASASAGHILLTSSSHVVMITMNDTVTHRYSAHTRDRNNAQFSNYSSYEYYVVN